MQIEENPKISIIPSQNEGMEAKIIAVTVRVASSLEYCFTADTTPKTIPITALKKNRQRCERECYRKPAQNHIEHRFITPI